MVLHRASESDDRFIEKIIALGLQAINIPLKSGHLSNGKLCKKLEKSDEGHNPFEIRASFELYLAGKIYANSIT